MLKNISHPLDGHPLGPSPHGTPHVHRVGVDGMIRHHIPKDQRIAAPALAKVGRHGRLSQGKRLSLSLQTWAYMHRSNWHYTVAGLVGLLFFPYRCWRRPCAALQRGIPIETHATGKNTCPPCSPSELPSSGNAVSPPLSTSDRYNSTETVRVQGLGP